MGSCRLPEGRVDIMLGLSQGYLYLKLVTLGKSESVVTGKIFPV